MSPEIDRSRRRLVRVAVDPDRGSIGVARAFVHMRHHKQISTLLFDRATESLWSQMRVQSVCGNLRATRPALKPVVQSTWVAWKALHPETTVVSFTTGFSRECRASTKNKS